MPRIRTLLSGITTFALSINMFLCGGFSVAAIGRDLPYDPYYGYTPIRTVAELNAIRNDLDGKYYLANDILFTDEDFAEGGVCYNDGVGWIAIGDSESPFTGELDGKNHTISGLKIRYNGQRNQRSLFGRNDGILRRLNIQADISLDITLTEEAFVGSIAMLAAENYGQVLNCASYGSITINIAAHSDLASYGRTICVAGLIAENNGYIYAAANHADIIVQTPPASAYSIFGINAGGICGKNIGDISNCFNIGDIEKTPVSMYDTTVYDNVAGIVGSHQSGRLEYCYNTGNIKNGGYGSAIADYFNPSANTDDCIQHAVYLDNVEVGCRFNYNADTKRATAVELKQESTFNGWDFKNIWKIQDGKYPILRQDTVDTENGLKAFSAGNGTADSPFVITRKHSLLYINRNMSAHYRLDADISMTDTDFAPDGAFYQNGLGWTGIISNIDAFTGVFDGNGHFISGLKSHKSRLSYTYANIVCLTPFVWNEGKILNLHLTDVEFKPVENEMEHRTVYAGLAVSNYGVIENCSVEGTALLNTKKEIYYGGLIDYNIGVAKNCYADVSLQVTESGGVTAGGIVRENQGQILNSYNLGTLDILSTCEVEVGGITGKQDCSYDIPPYSLLISCCYNMGDILVRSPTDENTNSSYLDVAGGGITRRVDHKDSIIQDCFNAGRIIAAGMRDEPFTSYMKAYAGGIVGVDENGKIATSYNTASITAFLQGGENNAWAVGGIVGYSTGDVVDCVSADLLGYTEAPAASGRLVSPEEMSCDEGFAGFDFQTIWEFTDPTEDYHYPILRATPLVFVEKTVELLITRMPDKLDFTDAEPIDLAGMEVSLLYNGGRQEPTENYEIYGPELYYGENMVLLTYTDEEALLMTSLVIQMVPRPLKNIIMESSPIYSEYFQGDWLYLEGAALRLQYQDGTEKTIPITDDMVNVDQLNTIGTINVKVSFFGYETTFPIQVYEQRLHADSYRIDRTNQILSGIAPNTTVNEFLTHVQQKSFVLVAHNSGVLKMDATLSTGDIVILTDGENVLDAMAVAVTGDVNGDGKITLTDYAQTKAHLLRKTSLKGASLAAADINKNGQVTLTDYAQMKAFLLGKGSI